MKRLKLLTKPTHVNEMNFDDLYEEISTDLDSRIRDFRNRHSHRLDEDWS